MKRWVSMGVGGYRVVVTKWADGTKELELQRVIAYAGDSIRWITVLRTTLVGSH